MDKRRVSQWMVLAVVCLSFSIGESYAQKNDFGNLARYSKQNAALPKATKQDKRDIFMGNSITEGWVRTHPDFFKSIGYIGRGISGQTSYQFLLRFREDVINLSPALVVINAGTNDVAENTQTYNEDYTFGNIVSMTELAKANKIKVILTSVLPPLPRCIPRTQCATVLLVRPFCPNPVSTHLLEESFAPKSRY